MSPTAEGLLAVSLVGYHSSKMILMILKILVILVNVANSRGSFGSSPCQMSFTYEWFQWWWEMMSMIFIRVVDERGSFERSSSQTLFEPFCRRLDNSQGEVRLQFYWPAAHPWHHKQKNEQKHKIQIWFSKKTNKFPWYLKSKFFSKFIFLLQNTPKRFQINRVSSNAKK